VEPDGKKNKNTSTKNLSQTSREEKTRSRMGKHDQNRNNSDGNIPRSRTSIRIRKNNTIRKTTDQQHTSRNADNGSNNIYCRTDNNKREHSTRNKEKIKQFFRQLGATLV